ncbi:MAG TPA: glycoside hydrolase family 15 protein [Chloroflexota bacterium]|jgi:GH15 family glucan-1,4-alpha-glucosidase
MDTWPWGNNVGSYLYPSIGEHAIVGDCHTAALIARDGTIDWWCPGRFDAPAVFCRLLDFEKGGYLRTVPSTPFELQRAYHGMTNVLESTFSTRTGTVRATDCMPVCRRDPDDRGCDVAPQHRLLRRLECLEGEVDLTLEFKPSFDYARARSRLVVHPSGTVTARGPGLSLRLACAGARLRSNQHGGVSGRLRLRAGEQRWIVLSRADDGDSFDEKECQRELAATVEYWQRWAARCTYFGPYRDQVLRSALVLKLLMYEPTGAVVAAPTTSLPESIGGRRNWDYRYTWLRDSSLIQYALLGVGYDEEATDHAHWLERTVGSDPGRRPRTLYAIDGRRSHSEEILPHLEGYQSSRPVRIGNAAASQRQLDMYGEVLRTADLHYHLRHQVPSAGAWRLLRDLVDHAAEDWEEAGSGIWEVRCGPRAFLYGKLMCWTALDCGVRLAESFHLEAPLARWQDCRRCIRDAILERGYDLRLGAFTQAFGSTALDATALVIPRVGFLPASDPRVKSTVRHIQRHLTRDGLVYRYRTFDGLNSHEGTFTLCTFWLVDALALGGQLREARELFERTLDCANDLGLLSEEIDPETGEQLGNFPQGFSHMALIGAAVNLARAEASNGQVHGVSP